jgi:NitT/TauT family transport system substrate-binding protein
MMRRGAFVGGLGVAAGTAVVPRIARAQSAPPLRVATIPVDVGAQAYYAQDRGLFQAAGLTTTVTTIPIAAQVAAAVAGGSVDIGQANVMSLAAAYERGLPFAYIAAGGLYRSDKPTSMMLVRKDSPLSGGASLSDKVVAINGLRTVTQVAIQAWADQNGGDSSKVRFLEIPFAEMEAALSARRVDVALMAEPDATMALSLGRTRIFGKAFDAIGKTWMIGGWFARTEWISANPGLVRAFAGALREAGRWANGHQVQSAQILEANTKIAVGTANRVVYADALDPRLIQPQIDIAAKYALIPHDLAATSLIAATAATH